jgi:hypothetical protein
MKNFISPDLIFSDWIFLWAILYYIITVYPSLRSGLSPYIYQSINPSIPLYIVLIYSLIEVTVLWFTGVSAVRLLEIIIIMFVIKIVWIYLLRNTKILLRENIAVMAILFVIYNLYLYLNNTDIISLYKNINKSLLDGDNRTPFMYLIGKLLVPIRVLLSYDPSRPKATCTPRRIR